MSIPVNRSLLTRRPLQFIHQHTSIRSRLAHSTSTNDPQSNPEQNSDPDPEPEPELSTRHRNPFWNEEAQFPIGQKKVFLPDFTITLLRTPLLPPTHAQFRVPLSFTKLDLRDYLYHAYGVKVRSVRTTIHGPKISPRTRNPDPSALRGPLNKRQRRLQRDIDAWARDERVNKLMLVQLERPFVWPAAPSEETLETLAGQQGLFRQLRVEQERQQTRGQRDEQDRKGGLVRYADLAAKLRRGEVAWGQGEGVPGPQDRKGPRLEELVESKAEADGGRSERRKLDS